jgi:hypothetical protein
MSGTMMPYIVRQGDYLAKLAFVLGFDADEVWNDPKNADLKTLRPNPNILAPGDILYVPEKKPDDGLPIEKGADNNYSAPVPKVEVVLVFRSDDQPLANEPCEVLGLDGADPSTDADGKLTLKIPVTIRQVSVHFTGPDLTYDIRVGDMDPHTEDSGVKKRLANLGFFPQTSRRNPDIDEDEMLGAALSLFQKANGLEPTGKIDDATRKALIDGHQQ